MNIYLGMGMYVCMYEHMCMFICLYKCICIRVDMEMYVLHIYAGIHSIC